MTFTRRVSSCFSQFLGFANRSFNSYKLPGDPSSSPSLTYGIHIFHCPDEVGIVAKLSERIASRGGNILGADVFVPQNKNVFYSRSEFVFDPVRWPRKQMDEDFLKLSNMFSAIRSVARVPALDPKFKIAVLASKQDHCLVDLLYGWQEGRLPVDITCVIRTYGKDVINIHHGLLPSFKGGNPCKQAFDAGVKLIGATSHFVTEELDSGPIIEQMVERVSHRDNLQSFVQKSENLEKQCLAKALRWYCELRVLPYEENRTVVF
ncbi:hypothetical protein Goshw_008449 [Gossypium schwendimanii]|uniref:ACT domain-containing protein n=1 Tax=Gossypium schwendimanii TaxID=34291 RepID=A0A7J9KWP1_GOSSC|nr:hypothetical protein [Gossypium schwendimanii]